MLIDSGVKKIDIYKLSYYTAGVNLALNSPITFNFTLNPISMNGSIKNYVILTGMNISSEDTTKQFDI